MSFERKKKTKDVSIFRWREISFSINSIRIYRGWENINSASSEIKTDDELAIKMDMNG